MNSFISGFHPFANICLCSVKFKNIQFIGIKKNSLAYCFVMTLSLLDDMKQVTCFVPAQQEIMRNYK